MATFYPDIWPVWMDWCHGVTVKVKFATNIFNEISSASSRDIVVIVLAHWRQYNNKTIKSFPLRCAQCDQIWRNFVTLAKSSKSWAIFPGSIYYLAKSLAYSGIICILLGKFSLMSLGKMWKNNLAIWSHWPWMTAFPH